MFNYNQDVLAFPEVPVTFIRTGDTTYLRTDSRSLNSPEEISILNASDTVRIELEEFEEQRPEALVYDLPYSKGWIGPIEPKQLMEMYDTLLCGCILIRAHRVAEETGKSYDSELVIKRMHKVLKWLHSTDFYTAPASTVYHEAYECGLIYHSLKVAAQAAKLYRSEVFPASSLDEVVLIALIHDWCKIGLYTSYQRNVKNEVTGQWEAVTAFKKKDDIFSPFGHGVSSLYLAMKFFTFTEEEALAIRWHMGEYNAAENEMNDLHYANENYPLVQLIQFADRLAITNYIQS